AVAHPDAPHAGAQPEQTLVALTLAKLLCVHGRIRLSVACVFRPLSFSDPVACPIWRKLERSGERNNPLVFDSGCVDAWGSNHIASFPPDIDPWSDANATWPVTLVVVVVSSGGCHAGSRRQTHVFREPLGLIAIDVHDEQALPCSH